jgi:hypothetical protein
MLGPSSYCRPSAGSMPTHVHASSISGWLPSGICYLHLQMGELLRKNPAVAVPVVLARLVQKDSEWCALIARFSPVLS